MMFSFLHKRKQSEDTPTVRLMKALHFGGKDLDLNRAGELSDLQKRRLNQDFLWRIFFAGIVAVLIAGAFLDGYWKYPIKDQVNPYLYFMPFFAIIGIGGFSYAIYRHRKNISTGYIVAFTGRAKKHDTASIIFINYEDRTERIYDVRGRAYSAFLDAETYTIYSLSFNEKMIVSAEHIPSP